METTTNEHVIGGFLSNGLIYKTKKNYAIYATNKRLIGLESPRNPVIPFSVLILGWILGFFLTSSLCWGLLDGIILGFVEYILLGAMTSLGDFLPGKRLRPTYELKVLRELEKRKDMSIPKEDIIAIELTPPSEHASGHLKITTKTGNPIEISIPSFKAFEKLKAVLKAFYSELCQLSSLLRDSCTNWEKYFFTSLFIFKLFA